MEIRAQLPGDLGEVLALTRLAFGDEGDEVARLVALQASEPVYGSRGWVAVEDGRIVGHVALTDGWIDAVRALVPVPVLSPLSVLPDRQGRGIGGALVGYAVAAADAAGAPAVVLEGDPGYYSRLGFEPAEDRGLQRPSTAIPERAFQWVRLAAYAPWMRGRFVYPDLFWRIGGVGLRDWRARRATGVQVSTVTIGARDLPRLARFYAELLGLPVPEVPEGADWVALRDTDGWSLAIQQEPEQLRVTWPAGAGDQHMQIHLEIRADDLSAAVAHAVVCGASEAGYQPQEDVRVMLDPEGHPFCLWVET